MIRAAVRVILWLVKGVLLLIALAALVAWPWSCARPGMAAQHGEATSFATTDGAETEIVHRAYWLIIWVDGKIRASEWNEWFPEADTRKIPGWRRRPGPGWYQLGYDPRYPINYGHPDANALGPLRWQVWNSALRNHGTSGWYVSLPLWLLALVTGAWPLASVALLIRRRRRLRLRRRPGCCRQCGYDLRSTPDASGPPLTTCPECGDRATAR